jgi:histidine triad (HIT) family protein
VSNDFYCDEVLSGRTAVQKVAETNMVLAFHHTRPFYPVHIVVIPKRHILSLIALEVVDDPLPLSLNYSL